jgi:hypothetical protein
VIGGREMSDEVEISKYRIVIGSTRDLADKMNALVEEGYRFIENLGPVQVLSRINTNDRETGFAVVMGLRSTPDYPSVKNIVNIDISQNDPKGTPLVEKMIGDGDWRMSTAYSKHVTLVKVK